MPCTASLLQRNIYETRFNNHCFPIDCFLLRIFIHFDAHQEIPPWKIAIQSHTRRIGSSSIQVGEHFDQDVTNWACLLLEEDACDATHRCDTSLYSRSYVVKRSWSVLEHSSFEE